MIQIIFIPISLHQLGLFLPTSCSFFYSTRVSTIFSVNDRQKGMYHSDAHRIRFFINQLEPRIQRIINLSEQIQDTFTNLMSICKIDHIHHDKQTLSFDNIILS